MSSIRIASAFEGKFYRKPDLSVRAPGRINLIGEHTDYNDGFVLPAAIDKAIYFALAKRDDYKLSLYAVDLQESFEIDLKEIEVSSIGWVNYLLGVVKELQDKGSNINCGFDLAFGGDVPLGAGLSSSAAIESGMGFAINELYDLDLSRLDLAKAAQNAEHNFVGVRCGIMDMYASLFGLENKVICLDCRDLSHNYLPFDLEDTSILLFNTGITHNLANSEYNKRREECENGVGILQEYLPDIKSLRDVKLSDLEKYKQHLSPVIFQRCFYVISETERMYSATTALENGDIGSFGELMFETHEGLKNDYDVSCEELDFLVDRVKGEKGVLGARMMGGGFGGCTINLVKNSIVTELVDKLSIIYLEQFGMSLAYYKVNITNGCSVSKVSEKTNSML